MRKYFRGRSVSYVLQFFLAAPLALIIWLGIEIINIFQPVYIVGLSYKGRISHYLGPMELHLRQANQSERKYLMIFVMPAATPNGAVRTIYRRHSLIVDSHYPQIFRSAFGMVSVLLKDRFSPVLLGPQLLWSLDPATTLNQAEVEFGKKLLKQLGVPVGAEYVCLGVKEAAYYASITPDAGYGQDLRHQAIDSRNVNIENYMLAATHLAELGIYVVRIGSVVSAPLPKDRHPLIIDYATEARSELGDVVLGANCKFFICGATGSFLFAASNNRPIVYTDHYFENNNKDPIYRFDQLPHSVLINRMYQDISGTLLSFKTIIDKNIELTKDPALAKMGVTPIPNSPSEILGAVSELNQRIDNNFDHTVAEDSLQNKFYRNFHPPFPWREYALMRVANSFLRKYQDLL